jgi:hypothetical protein
MSPAAGSDGANNGDSNDDSGHDEAGRCVDAADAETGGSHDPRHERLILADVSFSRQRAHFRVRRIIARERCTDKRSLFIPAHTPDRR